MSRKYDHGSMSQNRQLARSEVKSAFTVPPSSLPNEEPVLPTDGFAPKRALAHVVVNGQPAVVEDRPGPGIARRGSRVVDESSRSRASA